MKKNGHLKTQIAVFAFSLTLLKAAEQRAIQIENLSLHPQEPVATLAPSVRLTKDDVINQLSQGMHDYYKEDLIKAVEKVDKDRYTDAFINTVTQLSQGIDDFDKVCVINAAGNVNPDRYTDAFVATINQLSQGMEGFDKACIIQAVKNVDPIRYTDAFVTTINQLSQETSVYDKVNIIEAVKKIDSDRYTDVFVNIVHNLSQEMNVNEKLNIIETVGKIDPNRYTDVFVNIVHNLSQGVSVFYKKLVIEGVGNVHPDSYTDFINIVHQMSQEMNDMIKAEVVKALGNVHPDHYTDFINTVHQLSQEMNANEKACIIVAVKNVDPVRYTDAFVTTINQLSQGIRVYDKVSVIESVGRVASDNYPFLQNFIQQHPRYFEYVTIYEFSNGITENMTSQQLQAHLQQLRARCYRHDAPASTPQALAFEIHNFADQEVVGETFEIHNFADQEVVGETFEIHNFANQEVFGETFEIHNFANQNVVGETGEKQSFNGAVLEHLQRSIQGDVLSYDVILDLLRAELATLQSDPLKSDAIKEDVYNWVIEINEDPQDKNAIALVVTYLEQKDNTHGKLATWLYAFMDESKNAYDGRNSESCKKGVKERVITSLRSAIPEGDAALENFFHQAEGSFMMAAKSNKLTDHAFWAEKLQQKGVTPITPEPQAKDKFKEALIEFFAADESAQEIIDEALYAFDDSDNASDGLWSKIKREF